MAIAHDLRTFKNAAWLGWQMEANWTDPFVFAIYSIVKPIAGSLILVFMYMVITSGETQVAFFSYMFIGNAFYMYIAEILFGVTWVIHDDREHYMTLKQVYIAPINFYTYILGRAAIKIAITTIGVLVTLAFGVIWLGVDIDITAIDWAVFFPAFLVGMMTILIMGLALGGVTFLTAEHGIGINEGVAGIFYVLSGVIFPITVLPTWAQSISHWLPVTYWMEAIRRGLSPDLLTALPGMTGLEGSSNTEILLTLLASTLVFAVISVAVYRFSDWVARRKGKIDWTTAY